MRRPVLDDAQAVAEAAHDVAAQRHHADVVELRLPVDRRAQHGEPLTEVVGSEVVEAGLLGRLGDELVDVHQPTLRSTTVRPMVRRAS